MLRPIAHDILLVVVCSYDKTYGDVSSVLCSVFMSCLQVDWWRTKLIIVRMCHFTISIFKAPLSPFIGSKPQHAVEAFICNTC